MFLQFFTSLRDAQVPVTLREYLTLMGALDADLADQSVEHFYYLSRASLVKDERNLDKFDRVFGSVFKGLESLLDAMDKAEIPEEWLKKLAEKYLTEEEKKRLSNFPIGQGLFFAGQSHVHIQIQASPTEQQLITTNPQAILQQSPTEVQNPRTGV